MAQTVTEKTPSLRQRPGRAWLPRVGPGLVIAVAASIAVWQLAPNSSTGKPKIERPTSTVQPTVGLSAPDPEWLQAQSKQLALDAAQVKRLDTLTSRWQKETKALYSELDRASGNFTAEVPSQGARGANLQQVREQAGPVSQLTRQLLDARRAWWAEACLALTPAQRTVAEESWAHRFERRTGGHDK